MALLGLNDVTLSHGGPRLLDGATLQIDDGERVGLLGRNASGKSTLLALLAGDLEPDSGDVSRRQGLTWGRLPQDVPRGLSGRVIDVMLEGARPGEEAWRTRERLARLLE